MDDTAKTNRTKENTPEDSGVALNRLLEKCAKASGFVVCAGIRTERIDDHGDFIIDIEYQRINFSFEETKTVLAALKQHLKDNMAAFVDQEEKPV